MSSDEALDREWQQSHSSQRPQSTMARSFSLALNDLFKIDGGLADLDAAVDQKKKAVSSQNSELEALEARLRATEERLKQAATNTNTNTPGRSGRSSPRPRVPLGGDTFDPPKDTHATSPLASEFRTSRPSTARREIKDGRQEAYRAPPMPGALPPTPGASEGESDPEYVVVRRADLGEDGDAPRLGN